MPSTGSLEFKIRIGTRYLGGLDVTRQIRMMAVFLAMFVAAGYSQTAPAPAPAPVDPAQQMAAMQKKLDDWPQLSRYREANAALAAPAAGEKRVVFFGDSITDGW